jgi:hypothetical protein
MTSSGDETGKKERMARNFQTQCIMRERPTSEGKSITVVNRDESRGPDAENKTEVTSTTFMRFRGPGALDDRHGG